MDTIKMKRNGVRAVALLLVLATLLAMCGCSVLSTPRTVVLTYMNAIRQGNIEKMISCLKPSSQERIEKLLGWGDSLFGIDSKEALGSLLGTMYDYISENCEFKITDVRKTSADKADVDVNILVNGERVYTATVSCVKIDGRWYIDL